MKEEHFITFAICVVVIVVVGAVVVVVGAAVTADLLSRKARLECYQVVGNP